MLWPVRLLATPAISNVSGTVASGETLTVTGTGFTTKANGALPVKFDDFETGTSGNVIGPGPMSNGFAQWYLDYGASDGTAAEELPIYVNAATAGISFRPGSGITIRCAAPDSLPYGNGQTGGGFGIAGRAHDFWTYPYGVTVSPKYPSEDSVRTSPGWRNQRKVYLDTWAYYRPKSYPGGTSRNWKYIFFQSHFAGGGEHGHSPYPGTWCGTGVGNFVTKDGGPAWDSGGNDYLVGRWCHLQLFVDANTSALSDDGTIIYMMDGDTWVNRRGTVTLITDMAAELDNFFFGGYMAHDAQGSCPAVGHLESFWDDAYVDTTWNHIEIGDASTYAACTQREIQLPTSWSDTSLQFTVRQGGFADLNGKYLYITDNNAVWNTVGYALGAAAQAATITIDNVTHDEGDADSTAYLFTVTRSDNDSTISVNWATANNTATTANNDYGANSGTANFTAGGSLTATFTVYAYGDTIQESDETFFVNLSGCSGCTIADAQGVGTITNDDAGGGAPASIAYVKKSNAHHDTVAEASPHVMTFASPVTAGNLLVWAGTWDGVYVVDSIKTDTGVKFAAASPDTGSGGCNGQIWYLHNVSGSSVDTVRVWLSGTMHLSAIIGEFDGFSTSDPLDVKGAAIGTGTTATLNLTTTSADELIVGVSGHCSATTPMTSGSGYTELDEYETSADVPVHAEYRIVSSADTFAVPVTYDASRDWHIEAASFIGAAGGGGPVPIITIGDASADEGDTLMFVVTRDDSTTNCSVDYATADSTAHAGTDYTGISITTLNFVADAASKDTIYVLTTIDANTENHERIKLYLQSPSGCTISDSLGVGTLVNDDLITLSIPDTLSIVEGSGSIPTIEFSVVDTITVTRSAIEPPGLPSNLGSLEFGIVSRQGGDSLAVGGLSYLGPPSITDFLSGSGGLVQINMDGYQFSEGEPSQNFQIKIAKDHRVEPNEQFAVYLQGVADYGDTTGYVLQDSVMVITIVNDDVAGITVTPTSGSTTEAGGTMQFTVVLTSEPADTVTIGISSNDTSEGTVDKASLVLAPSNWYTAQTVTVTGQDDALQDGTIAYSVVTAAAVSDDANYDTMNASDVSLTNTDDEPPVVTASERKIRPKVGKGYSDGVYYVE